MSGVYKLEIIESAQELQKQMHQQKNSQCKERIQVLYLLKSQQAKTVSQAAQLIGRHRATVQEWLSLYRQGGIERLLEIKPRQGRQPIIPAWAVKALEKKLQEPEGFKSYYHIQQWLSETLGVYASYFVVYRLVRYQLKAKLKVPRPVNIKQDEERFEQFKVSLASNLSLLVSWLLGKFDETYRRIRYWCQDESRFGLHTVGGRKITAPGIKPLGPWQWKFQAFWLYGAVDPASGESFVLEFSHADVTCFQRFLEELSGRYPQELHIIHLDRGRSHTAKKLVIPDNVILLFQPPYSPELNPIERLWQHLKRDLRWDVFSTLEQLRERVSSLLEQLTHDVVLSLTGWDYIRHALSVAQLN